MPFKSYRKESHQNYGVDISDAASLTHEQIQLGAVLRIADAVEQVAKDRIKLEKDIEYWKSRANTLEVRNLKQQKQMSSMKGWISRYKKEIEELKGGANG